MAVYVGDQILGIYDGQEPQAFDIDSGAWHHYEFYDIDWESQTYSLAVDGETVAEGFEFYEPMENAEGIHLFAQARDIEGSGPVSVSVDEIVVYE